LRAKQSWADMLESLQLTFETLTDSRNPNADAVLIDSLDFPNEKVCRAAITAIFRRRASGGIIEIIRRLHHLDSGLFELVVGQSSMLDRELRQCLTGRDVLLRANGLVLVRRGEMYSLFPSLLSLIDEPDLPDREAVVQAVVELVNRLYEHCTFGAARESRLRAAGELPTLLRDAQRIRTQILGMLDSTVPRYSVHGCKQIIECILILGDADDFLIKKLFQEATEVVKAVATDILMTSAHPGVMSVIVDSLYQNYPSPAALAALQKRSDPEFAAHLLRNLPADLSPFQRKNLGAIKSVAWLEPAHMQLGLIPPGLHLALVGLLASLGLPAANKVAVLDWLVKFGGVEGRQAATSALANVGESSAHDVLLESLESEEAEVQAWATGNLRSWAIPNAMELLIERLDSPLPEVQQAAREELGDFSFMRVLEMFDQLDHRLHLPVGELVRKIDPLAIDSLKKEILHEVRRRRIKALRVALALNLHADVDDAVRASARDADPLVRRMAIEILRHLPSPETVDALKVLLHDPSPRIREAAGAALAHIQNEPVAEQLVTQSS
jgi:HEAT repeat protein